jgi:uncharacterized protein YqeY
VSITERVQEDLTGASKARDQRRVSALRLVLDALRKAAKEAREELGEADEVAVLSRERKRRVEAAEAYRSAGREELAAGEDAEAALIDTYLPEQLSDSELEALVENAVSESGATDPKEMGKVMSVLMPKLSGRADGKRVSALVREKLSGP